jgi:RNA polymerase sigma-70 factor (ECF subfamily)
MRPDVERSGSVHRLGQSVNALLEEDAEAVRAVGGVESGDGRVVEAVKCHHPPVSLQDIEHQPLDPLALDLDEQLGAARDRTADVQQGRNGDAGRGLARRQLVARERRDRCPIGEGGVVMDDDVAVPCGMDVEFDAIRPEPDRQRKAGKGVLAKAARHPAMGDAKRHGSMGQVEAERLGVVCSCAVAERHPPLNIRTEPASNLPDRMPDLEPTTDDATDLDLVQRWKDGDQRAATRLVERHADAVARFAASLGAREDVDEVVQDTFVRAFGSLDGFRGESAFRTWLFTIARRLLLDRRRAVRRRGEQVEVKDTDVRTEWNALDAVVAEETEGRMRAALEHLTPTQREVFTLRVGEGMSYKDIADVASTTEGAARVHYHNAMRAIKEFLDD